MSDRLDIRDSAPSDLDGVATLLRETFPDEDLTPLVRALLSLDGGVASLVSASNDRIVGHVVFTRCDVGDHAGAVALLGPLAVAADRRRLGIGGALIKAGLRRAAAEGAVMACVLGDPAYYSRFGFEAETRVAPPYPLPEVWRDAWRSIALVADAPALQGPIAPPAPWRNAALWGP